MRLYGKVEVCTLIGIYMLSLFGETYNINNARLQKVESLFGSLFSATGRKIKKTFPKNVLR